MKKITILITIFISINTFNQNSTVKKWYNYKKSKLENYNFNDTLNLIDVDKAATYKGCENFNSNISKINCLNTSLSIRTSEKINRLVKLNRIKLKKGINKLRVQFFIDENGHIIVGKIIVSYTSNIKNSISKIIESATKLIPVINLNKIITVKYSLRIPFLIK